MLRRLFLILLVPALVGASLAWWITAPDPLPEEALAGTTGDPVAGEVVFHAAGCAGCHIAPEAEAADPPVLSGGQRFTTDFGTFLAPNISSDPVHGIGDWSDLQIASAVMRGVSPEGAHYYPAFPYTSYLRAEVQDIADLIAYMRSLPADATPSQPHEIGFPFNIRRSLGGWKWLYLSRDWAVSGDLSPEQARGRYLVEALAHCGECHTPRTALGGPDRGRWLAGGPNPDGEGRIPNITPAALRWSEAEIAEYLSSGFTPEFDTAGGAMAEVIRNTARLSGADRAAIAAYLKAVPAVE